MLWDPSFATWEAFGVRINSQMALLSPDLTRGTELWFGFDDEIQGSILELAADLSAAPAS